jgi:hypothetical protein
MIDQINLQQIHIARSTASQQYLEHTDLIAARYALKPAQQAAVVRGGI